MSYEIRESGDCNITIDGEHVGSVRYNQHTGLYSVCVLLDVEPPLAPPSGMRVVGSLAGDAWSLQTEEVPRDYAMQLAREACEALIAMRADSATDAGHVPYMPSGEP